MSLNSMRVSIIAILSPWISLMWRGFVSLLLKWIHLTVRSEKKEHVFSQTKCLSSFHSIVNPCDSLTNISLTLHSLELWSKGEYQYPLKRKAWGYVSSILVTRFILFLFKKVSSSLLESELCLNSLFYSSSLPSYFLSKWTIPSLKKTKECSLLQWYFSLSLSFLFFTDRRTHEWEEY